jgi:mono/diheme cytochrome c family protein
MTDKSESRLHGTYAEFDSVDPLLAACRRVRDAGYTKTDAYTPFPVHGIDKALGIKPTVLPWIALVGGLTGTTIALTMQIWMNAIDYPYIISGKPFISMPAFIPVTFELTVLLASFGAFFGMLALNKLPRYSNPVFTDPRFDRATDDKFFLYIEADDPKYNKGAVEKLFGDFGSSHIGHIYEDTSSTAIPKFILMGLGLLALGATIPALAVARMRVTNSDKPRFHVFYDMDFSPAKGPQQVTTLFADGRTMRPDVPGTVAVGQYDEALDFYTGIDMEQLSKVDAPRASRLVRALLEPIAQEGDEPETLADEPEAPADEPKTPADEPEAPADEPEAPADDPEAPADEPKTPADEPEVPAEEPKTGELAEGEEPMEQEPATEEKSVDEPATENEPADEPATEEKASDEPTAEVPAEEMKAETAPEPAVAPEPEATKPEPAAVPAAAPPTAPTVVDKTPWLKENPLPLSTAVLQKGREKFEIYCAVCHGNDGAGNGLVNRRAQRILATAWVQPSSMHQDTLYADQYADGKLFNTITNGVRKMPGYASQISAKDRWAIVAYVRALQASQNAAIDDLPSDKRNEIKKLQAEIAERLAEQAEQERKKAEEASGKP